MAALEQWPDAGVPDNPGAWLMATAKHRAIDRIRRGTRLARKLEELGPSRRRGDGPATSTRRSTTTSATTCCG